MFQAKNICMGNGTIGTIGLCAHPCASRVFAAAAGVPVKLDGETDFKQGA
jgi:hypothetical protein